MMRNSVIMMWIKIPDFPRVISAVLYVSCQYTVQRFMRYLSFDLITQGHLGDRSVSPI